jgi:uncharacterized protein YbaP (TraB family)
MKTFRTTLFILFLSAISISGISQKENWAKTLLWKIERSDLKKPSFLFGTMHLQDKRLFNLGDSFYYHFERAEGFAIEVDFNEYMDSLLNRSFAQIEERELNEDDEKVNSKEELKIPVPDSTVFTPSPPSELKSSKYFKKYFRKIRNERIKRLLVYGEMPTILDAYLYGMAMKQGKWLGAVEEVKDQLNLKDELGKDLDEEDMRQPGEKMTFALDTMIRIYLAQDLNRIEEYALRNSNPKRTTVIFNNRNVKMLNSIDSLSHFRSMFYAVGAAHLPGDSGLIKLLRGKGYIVTPVLSNNTIAAEKYARDLPVLSWYQVGQADSLYTIDMPGLPGEYNIFGDLVKMKVLVDMTTMTYYMTGHTISQFEENKQEEVLKIMANSMGGSGKVESVKKVDRDGLKGVEGIINGRDVYFRVQVLSNSNTAFFLLLGNEKKAAIITADANKYFNSFKVGNRPVSSQPKDWAVFELPEKAFSVLMPGKPKKNKLFEKQSENSGWNFTAYDYTDMAAGLYYIMQVRDIEPGRYLDGDSLYFSSFSQNLVKDNIQKLKEDNTMFNGFPAFRLDALTEKESLFYKTKSIIRGNRIYSMMALGNISKKEETGPEAFFDSFRFLEYKKAEGGLYTSEDQTFRTKAPAKFDLVKSGEDIDSTRTRYTCYNPYEVISYEVLKDFISKFYWAENDSIFFKKKAASYSSYTDSVLSYKNVQNGNLKGVEQVVQMTGSNNLKKVRLLLHGDTLYTLVTYVPSQYISNATHTDFFEQFRVANDKLPTTVFNNKAKYLLEGLQQKDSALFEEAKMYLGDASFTQKELPLLHQALLFRYPDDTLLYGSVASKLINVFDGLSDSSTVEFINRNYDKAQTGNDDGKAVLLNVLANYKTAYSYSVLKNLLVNKTPEKLKVRNSIGYQVDDSLELTRTLYPEILTLLKNQDFWQDVCDYTSELLDSNMLSSEVIRPYEKELNFIADTLLHGTEINEEEVWLFPYQSIVNLLGYQNSPASSKLLQQFVAGKDLYLKQAAIISLLRNNEPVGTKEIEKLAASNEFRIDFYDELKRVGKESYFTSKYHTQRYFAEAELYSYGDEDYSPSSMEFIGEREVLFDGEKKRMFLFKVVFSNDEDKDKQTYLGIAGPYPLDAKITRTNNDATEIFYDEEYDKKQVDRHFKELLRKGEEYLMKK